MKHTTQIRSVLLGLAALVIPACGSTTLFQANKKTLDIGVSALESDPAAAVRQAETLVTRTNEEASTYVLQRFFGAYLATEAHLAAAEHAPFLPDSPNRKAGNVRLAAAGHDEHAPSVGHLVAAMYHASLALEWLPRASAARTVEDGQPLLPEAYQTLGAADAGVDLLLTQIAIFACLRFQGKVDLYLRDEDHKALLDYAACKTIVERVRLQPWLRAWLDYAVFDFLRQEQPTRAYKFAVAAIALEEPAEGAFPHKLVEQLVQFVVGNDELEWVCPTCNSPSPPALARCINCDQVETVDFVPRNKNGARR